MNWFYESGGQQQGPVTEEELDRLIAEGKVSPTSLVWREGLSDWQPLNQARPPGVTSGGGVPGDSSETVRCASCGEFKPAAEIVQIGHRPICAACKPAVLLGLQQGSGLPSLSTGERHGPPWEQREELGLWTGIWRTVEKVLTLPSETFANMKREGGLNSPLLYFLITASVGIIAGALYNGLKVSAMPASNPPNNLPQLQEMMQFFTSWVGILMMCVLAPVFATVSSFLGAGLLHLCLMLCRGATQPFETTFRVYCYAHGSASVLQLVPFCGPIVGAVWGLVVTCIGLARAHEIPTGRAVLAVFLPMIVCCTIFVVVGIAVAGIGMASSNGHH